MKIYIAARASTRTDEVKAIQEKLVSMGHTITYDWASVNSEVLKPYRDPVNRVHNNLVIPMMLNAAANADIFILLDEPGIRGAYIEFGAFLAKALELSNDRQVYIVGPDSHERESVFESPEFVYFADNIDEVYSKLSK